MDNKQLWQMPLVGWWYRVNKRRKMRRRQQRKHYEWKQNGCPLPLPDLLKHPILRDYAEQYGLQILVETGTFHGDTVEVLKKQFAKVYTVELNQTLYEEAQYRFKPDKHVEVILGDSGVVLGRIISRIDRPALFWLDGHYSGGDTAIGECSTPIFKELTHVLQATEMQHVILIDDARSFGVADGYPEISELKAFVHEKNDQLGFEVKDDLIRITPS
ncbi:hypothetical protein ACFL6U_19935 [Planctomycetota bacterium]